MEENKEPNPKPSKLRWKILRQALLSAPSSNSESQEIINQISRKGKGIQSFDLIPCHLHPISSEDSTRDVYYSYSLPTSIYPNLYLLQRKDNSASINDFEICNKYEIDNTGLVCPWPSEEVLSYYCLSHVDMFRSKTIIELGAGYGLAGLVIAAVSEASEVVVSDGNPQVVECILLMSLSMSTDCYLFLIASRIINRDRQLCLFFSYTMRCVLKSLSMKLILKLISMHSLFQLNVNIL
ncbi:unnamed protein product [Amaranthus hypochondriacus]